jgi:hypothetical protein
LEAYIDEMLLAVNDGWFCTGFEVIVFATDVECLTKRMVGVVFWLGISVVGGTFKAKTVELEVMILVAVLPCVALVLLGLTFFLLDIECEILASGMLPVV